MIAGGRDRGRVRKLFQGTALIGIAVFLLALTQATTLHAAVVLMCCATGVGALAMSGFAPNCFDVAPRHADVIYGVSNTFATLPGIIGVYVTGALVDQTGSFVAPFVLTAGVAVLGALVYLAWASGKPQVV
jgi:ACS family sodium-dependent inorganic phosphate cotransporter